MAVSTPHPLYVAMQETWAALRDAFEGEGAVKGALSRRRGLRHTALPGTRYLPRPPGMALDEQYDLYRDRASWGDFSAITVNGLVGAIFRREPVVEIPAALEPQVADVTQTGLPLTAFAQQWMSEELKLHRYGVLIDFPQAATDASDTAAIAARTDAPPPPRRVPEVQPRPYWIAYPTEQIRNWRTMQRQGDTILSLVVLEECVPIPQGLWPTPDFFVVRDQTQYRVLRLNEFGEYEVSLWLGQPTTRSRRAAAPVLFARWVPLREGTPLDFIPFVFDPVIKKSLLEGLVEVNYRFYRHSADYEHALYQNAMPTRYVCSSALEPQTQLLTGADVAWIIPDSTASVGIIQPSAAGLPAHQIALDTDRKDMAALGARLLESPAEVTETRIAAANRTQGVESPIQSLITEVSRGLTQALQIHAWWAGFTENVDDPAIHMELNRDIVANDMPPQMLTALTQALLQHTISYETFWYNLQKGEIARPMIEAEEEQDLIELRQQAQALIAPPPQPFGGRGQPVVPPGQNGPTRQPA